MLHPRVDSATRPPFVLDGAAGRHTTAPRQRVVLVRRVDDQRVVPHVGFGLGGPRPWVFEPDGGRPLRTVVQVWDRVQPQVAVGRPVHRPAAAGRRASYRMRTAPAAAAAAAAAAAPLRRAAAATPA
jgi:hypothetical protein